MLQNLNFFKYHVGTQEVLDFEAFHILNFLDQKY
jgi:hypothetical protein